MVKVYKGNLWLKHMWRPETNIAHSICCLFQIWYILVAAHSSFCSFSFLMFQFLPSFQILLIPKMVHSKSCLFQILLIPNLQILLIPNLAHSKSYSFQIYDLTASKCAAQGFTLLISYILDLNGSYSCLQIFFQLHSSS